MSLKTTLPPRWQRPLPTSKEAKTTSTSNEKTEETTESPSLLAPTPTKPKQPKEESSLQMSRNASDQLKQQREEVAQQGSLRSYAPHLGGGLLQSSLQKQLVEPPPSSASLSMPSTSSFNALEGAFGAHASSASKDPTLALAQYAQKDPQIGKMLQAASQEPPSNSILQSFGVPYPRSTDGKSLLERHGITSEDIQQYTATGKMSPAMQKAYETACTMPTKQWGEPVTRFHEAQAITQLMHRIGKAKVNVDKKELQSQKSQVQRDTSLSPQQKSEKIRDIESELSNLQTRESDLYNKGLLPALSAGKKQNTAWTAQVTKEATINAAKVHDPTSSANDKVGAGTKADAQFAALARGARHQGEHLQAANHELQRADVQSEVFSSLGVPIRPSQLSGLQQAKHDLGQVKDKNTPSFHQTHAQLDLTTAKVADRFLEQKGLSLTQPNAPHTINALSPHEQKDVGEVSTEALQARQSASTHLNQQIDLLKGQSSLSPQEQASLQTAQHKLAKNEQELSIKGPQYKALAPLKDVDVPAGGRATDFPGAEYKELEASGKIPTQPLSLGASLEERQKLAAQFHQLGKDKDNTKDAFNNGCGPTVLLMAAYLDKSDPKGKLTNITDTALKYLDDKAISGPLGTKAGPLKEKLSEVRRKIQDGTATTDDLKTLQEATHTVMQTKEGDAEGTLRLGTMKEFMQKSGMEKSMKDNGMELKLVDTGQDLSQPTGHYVLSVQKDKPNAYIYDPWPRKDGKQLVTGKAAEVYSKTQEGTPAPGSSRAVSQEVWREMLKNTRDKSTGKEQELVKKLYALDQQDFDDFVMKMLAKDFGEMKYPYKFSHFTKHLTYDERLRFKASYDRLKSSGRINSEVAKGFEDPKNNDYAYILKGEKTTWETIWPWSYGGKTDW